MAEKKTVVASKLEIHALCPACDSDLTIVDVNVPDQAGHYDNGHDKGTGAYIVTCDSCGERLAIERDIVYDAQHQCLVLLGEADPVEEPVEEMPPAADMEETYRNDTGD